MLRLILPFCTVMTLVACGSGPGVNRLDTTPLGGPAFAEQAPEAQMTEQARALERAMAELARRSGRFRTVSAIDPALGRAQARMAWMNDRLAGLVAAQQDELDALAQAHDDGQVSKRAYRKRLAQITRAQDAVSSALIASAAQAKAATAALKSAGASGIDWYILSAETLADEAGQIAARAGLL